MDKSELLRHALNISRLMQSLSDFVIQETEPPPNLRTKNHQAEEFVNYGKYEEPIRLADIGLDDMHMAKIVIELSQNRDEFKIWTPFDQDFVDSIKEKIPKHARWWDPDERCWRVDCYWFGNAQELLPKYFYGIERHYTSRAYAMCEQLAREDDAQTELNREARRKQKQKTRNKNKSAKSKSKNQTKRQTRKPKTKQKIEYSPYDVLNVKENAPDDVVKAAHRVMARLNHSDLGGDENKMKKINEAFEQIKLERGWVKP